MFQLLTRTRLYAIFLLGLFVPSVFAETINGSALEKSCEIQSPATREDLVRIAVECNATQKAVTSHWQAQKHRVDVAGSLDDPRVTIGVAPQTFGDDQFDGGYIVEFSQPLPWPGILSLREKAAAAQADVWLERRSQEQILLARDVRLQIAQWQYHYQLLKINEQHQGLWQEFLVIVQSKYAAGTTNKSAVLQATQEHQLLLQESIELKANIERDISQIKRLLNLPSSVLLETTLLLNEAPPSLPDKAVTTLKEMLDSQPSMQALDARKRHKNFELELAEKDRYPTFTVMTRYNSLWMNEEQRWVVGVGFNLPFDFGKRSSREDSLRAEHMALRWEQQDLLIQLREQLVQADSYFQQARSVHQLYQDELLPLADENLITARNEYRSGNGDFLSLLTAQRQALTTQRKAQMAVRDQHAQFAQLTAAAGLVQRQDWNDILNIDVLGN